MEVIFAIDNHSSDWICDGKHSQFSRLPIEQYGAWLCHVSGSFLPLQRMGREGDWEEVRSLRKSSPDARRQAYLWAAAVEVRAFLCHVESLVGAGRSDTIG